jgi:uncharacterized protein (DUF2062 family)
MGSPIRNELRLALVRGIREYGHLSVGLTLVGAPVTAYLVIVGVTATAAVPALITLIGLIFTTVFSRRRRRAG